MSCFKVVLIVALSGYVMWDSDKRGKRGFNYDKQVERAVKVLNHVLKGSWGEEGSRGIRKKLK